MSLTPASPVEALAPFISARLRPLGDTAAAGRPPRSDYDLNPEGRMPGEGRTLAAAAVLVPLVVRESGLTVLLTRRSDGLRRHSGQVAFPGGRLDPGETPLDAALRETEEEVGVSRSFVTPLGLGDAYETGTGFAITPVVGLVAPGFSITRHEVEVAEVFETPFAFLMDPANHDLRVAKSAEGVERRFYAMPHEDRFIWGATAGMIRGLYERLFANR